ncbi:hypothetical protein [Nonomuraea helvata]|uniref:DUF222 domain-containing protein n=1 Tax=Nonomuraea helvata TaxID=37484 RepID=A0ABV5SIV6_9ACTN
MTRQNEAADPPRGGVDPVAALIGACHHFATHIDVLADQLSAVGVVGLSADDAERVSDAITRAFTATSLASALTVGLRRACDDDECPHSNMLTDAEWARLTAGRIAVNARKATYSCELEPGHPGPHMSLAQSYGEHDTWIRWADGARELVDLALCPSSVILADDPEPCLLFDGHPGNHSYDRGAVPDDGGGPSPERGMDGVPGE